MQRARLKHASYEQRSHKCMKESEDIHVAVVNIYKFDGANESNCNMCLVVLYTDLLTIFLITLSFAYFLRQEHLMRVMMVLWALPTENCFKIFLNTERLKQWLQRHLTAFLNWHLQYSTNQHFSRHRPFNQNVKVFSRLNLKSNCHMLYMLSTTADLKWIFYDIRQLQKCFSLGKNVCKLLPIL